MREGSALAWFPYECGFLFFETHVLDKKVANNFRGVCAGPEEDQSEGQ